MLSFLADALLYISSQMQDELKAYEKDLFEYLISPSFTIQLQNLHERYKKDNKYFIFYFTILCFVMYDRDYYVYLSSF